MSASLPPGWYPSDSPAVLRWWDGIRWTGEVRDADKAGADEAVAEAVPPTGEPWEESGEERSAGPGQAADAPASWRVPAVQAWEVRAAQQQAPRRRLAKWLGKSDG